MKNQRTPKAQRNRLEFPANAAAELQSWLETMPPIALDNEAEYGLTLLITLNVEEWVWLFRAASVNRITPAEVIAHCLGSGTELPELANRNFRLKEPFYPEPKTQMQLPIAPFQIDTGKMKYLFRVPRTVPKGKMVVHNHVKHIYAGKPRSLGEGGFRAWTEPADTTNRVVCRCNWAPHLEKHYRVAVRHGTPPVRKSSTGRRAQNRGPN